jgi:hypothetical protein
MKKPDHKHLSAERLSSRSLYAIVGLIIVVFALFWLVGYDKPYDEDPNFNAPLFTDALLVLISLVLLGTIGFSAWAIWRALKVRGKGERLNNNIPVKKIGYSILGGVVFLLLFTFLIGSSKPMTINGIAYNDVFWLKTADMLINTIIVLIVVATGSVIYGATKYIRRK